MNNHETTGLISEKDAKLIKLGLINNLLTEMVAVENSRKESTKNACNQFATDTQL